MTVTPEMASVGTATSLRAGTLGTKCGGCWRGASHPEPGTKQRLGYGVLVSGNWKIGIMGKKDLQQEQLHRSGKADQDLRMLHRVIHPEVWVVFWLKITKRR